MDKKALGNRLREVLDRDPKITQAEAARIMGVSPKTFYNYLAGETTPDVEALELFALNRGVPLIWLVTGEEVIDNEPWEVDVPVLNYIPAGDFVLSYADIGISGYVRSSVRDPEAFGLEVHGTSMHPEIQEGDIVICSPRLSFISGKIYAVVMNGEHTLKRVRFRPREKDYALIPSNKEFETKYVPADKILKLVRVVEVRRNVE